MYMENQLKGIFLKILLRTFYIVFSLILVGYLILVAILFYVGPWETRTVRNNLKKNPVDIVVSLTTTPYRIDKIKPVLDSILRQSIKPNRIYVNVPLIFKRDNNLKYIIPNWLSAYPNVVINRTKDYGPATKIIGTLEKERDPNTIIVTVDDDNIYPKHLVRDLIKQYLPGTYKVNYKMAAAITGIGLNFLFGPNFESKSRLVLIGDRPSLLVIGSGGVAYKRKFFKDDIFLLTEHLSKSCFLSDDLIISGYLYLNNVNIIKISGISFNQIVKELLIRELPTAFTSDALIKGANSDQTFNNKAISGKMRDINEDKYGQCMLDFPAYNKAKYQQIILQRSKIIESLYQMEILRMEISSNYIIRVLCYNYLNNIIHKIPFLKKMIIAVIG